MRRRRGITLLEVLVAIFIMAIGLLAILTLFPLGAMRMGEALQNDRTAAAASAAANTCDGFGIRTDPGFYNPPNLNYFMAPPVPGLQPAASNGSGYPLYIDPYGLANGSPATLAGNTTMIPRLGNPAAGGNITVYPGYTSAQALANRYFTLPDDVTFLDNGQPDQSNSSIQRASRYTWAYLLRRSQPASLSSSVDLTVVVYAARATAVPGGETTFQASGTVGDTNVQVTIPAGQTPNISRGGWILDASTDADPTTGVFLGVHGLFYRVVSVSQPNAATMNLELQVPLVSTVSPLTQITVMDNVADVFSRGTGTSQTWEFRNGQ